MSSFLFHPPGITVKIIEIHCGMHSRSCYAHHICGSLLTEDVAVCFRRLKTLLMAKRGQSSPPSMFWMELIAAVLAS